MLNLYGLHQPELEGTILKGNNIKFDLYVDDIVVARHRSETIDALFDH